MLALLLCACTFQAVAQSVAPLKVEDALNIRKFADWIPVSLSPDGDWLAYTVETKRRSEPMNLTIGGRGVPPWISGSDIYLAEVGTGETRNLTEGNGVNWLPTWSPDGRFLAFLSDRGSSGKAKLWLWDSIEKQTIGLADASLQSAQIEWTTDGQYLLVTAFPNSHSENELRGPSRENSKHLVSDETSGSTAIVYRSGDGPHDESSVKSAPWNLDLNLRDLLSVNLHDGRITTILANTRISTWQASPAASYVAYTIPERFERAGSQQILFDVGILNLSTLQTHIVAHNVRMDYDGGAFSWSPDGMLLSFHTGGVAEKTFDCYVIDLKSGNISNITNLASSSTPHRISSKPLWNTKRQIYFLNGGELWRAYASETRAQRVASVADREIIRMIPWSDNQLWSPDGGTSTVVVTHDDTGKQDGFYRVDLTSGKTVKLLEDKQCYSCAVLTQPFAVATTGQKLLYFSEDAQRDEDLEVSDPGFQNVRQVTHLNPQFTNYKMGSAKLIKWLSDDGKQLQGALLLPPNYVQGKRYPLIVWVYGGEMLSNSLDQFGLAGTGPFNMQLFATRGYVVLLPDAPQHPGTPMLDLAKTVLPGVNKVVEMGIADPGRIGLVGHSYGGYSVLSLLVLTDRFKTAVEIDGYGSLLSVYGIMGKDGSSFGISVEEEGQGLMMGTPWQYRERFIDNSPIYFLDRVKSSILIIHGSSDTAVPCFLGDQIFVALRRLGVETEYAKYEGESHSMYQWTYANQVDFCNRVIRWLDEHLAKGLVE